MSAAVRHHTNKDHHPCAHLFFIFKINNLGGKQTRTHIAFVCIRVPDFKNNRGMAGKHGSSPPRSSPTHPVPASACFLLAAACSVALWPLAQVESASLVDPPPWMTPIRVNGVSDPRHQANIDLPHPLQTARRMLVMINAYHFNASDSHIPNSLETFTNLCEQGEEVHIALHTTSPALAPYVLASTQRFFCQRLGSSLPIIVYQYDPDIKLRIAGVHRELVAAKVDVYDWFMYAEDDLALRAHNIDFLKYWTSRLAGKGMLPHLMRYEVASLRGVAAAETNGHRAPRQDAMLLDEYPFPVRLSSMHRRQVTLMQVSNPYMAMWFLPRDLLRPFLARPSWLDEVRRHADRNLRVHFATFWLLPYFKFVVPLHQFKDALVHHVSTHYSDIGLKHMARQRLATLHPLFLHEFYSQDAWDLEAWLQGCLEPDSTAPAGFLHVDLDLSGQCSTCLRRGKIVSVSAKTRREGVRMELAVACE